VGNFDNETVANSNNLLYQVSKKLTQD